jgi:hypothetical protein
VETLAEDELIKEPQASRSCGLEALGALAAGELSSRKMAAEAAERSLRSERTEACRVRSPRRGPAHWRSCRDKATESREATGIAGRGNATER